jgi:hypothetical protein
VFVPHRKHTYIPPRSVKGIDYFLYVDDIRTSQQTHLLASKTCYGDSLIFSYEDVDLTSQETQLRDPTACFGVSLTFLYVDNVRNSPTTEAAT